MKKTIFILIAGVSIVSCKKDDNQDSQSSSLWPLKVGSSWTFVGKEYNESGTVTDIDTIKFSAVGTKTFNSKEYYSLIEASSGSDTLYVRADANTVYTYDSEDKKESVSFKTNATEGEVLHTESYGQYKDETVASAGTFTIGSYTNSYKTTINSYFSTQLIGYEQLFLKPGIGWTGDVYFEPKISGSGYYKSYEAILSSYTLK